MKQPAAIWILVLAGLYVGSALAQSGKVLARRLPTPEETEVVQASVRETLNDPESARFRYLLVTGSEKDLVNHVCGQVNAKNLYGGYVGYRFFFGFLDRRKPDVQFHLIVLEKNESSAEAILEECSLS